jgi:hypothetical protein
LHPFEKPAWEFQYVHQALYRVGFHWGSAVFICSLEASPDRAAAGRRFAVQAVHCKSEACVPGYESGHSHQDPVWPDSGQAMSNDEGCRPSINRVESFLDIPFRLGTTLDVGRRDCSYGSSARPGDNVIGAA